jgi:hypothetical protein
VFLREYVPSRIFATGAGFLFGNTFRRADVSHAVARHDAQLESATHLRVGDTAGEFHVRFDAEPTTPEPGSIERFLADRHWAFGRDRTGEPMRFQIDHPSWRTHAVDAATGDIDLGALRGGRWLDVGDAAALHSVFVAEGSAAEISLPETLDARG